MKISAWWTMLFFAIAVILLYDKACNVPVERIQATEPIIVKDTVQVTEWKTDTFHHFITKYVTITDTDTVFMSSEIIKDYMNIREYNRMYDFGTACIDVQSLVFQNELAYQKVSYSTVRSEPTVSQQKNVKRLFLGSVLLNIQGQTRFNPSATFRSNNTLYNGSMGLDGKSGSFSVLIGVF